MRFSQRHGLKPVKKTVQLGSMDRELRNGLWNCLVAYCLEPIKKHHTEGVTGVVLVAVGVGRAFIRKLWQDFFKEPIDTIPDTYPALHEHIRGYYFRGSWDDVYDILEWIAGNHFSGPLCELFMTKCNEVLERELSGYRFVVGLITRLTSSEEISAIEESMEIPDPFRGPRTQIKSALEKLYDRKSPDYPGSIKESISAVEGVATIIAKEQVGGLRNALEEVEKRTKTKLHPSLKTAFIKLYGYTSDSKQGIRHALLDEPDLRFEDAKFMLVACSAFINYLTSKL